MDIQSSSSVSIAYPRLIGLSGKQFAGKDQVCGLLLAALPLFRQVPLALAIKQVYATEKNLTLEDIEANKAQYRPDLIALGDWGRRQDPDYWLKQVVNQPGCLIISDVRLRREYDLLREMGAYLIRVEADQPVRAARGTLVNETDLTECDLDAVSDWDAVIVNNGTMDMLTVRVDEVLRQSPFVI